MIEIDFVRQRFIKHFDGQTGNVYTSPGRINLIGEHTDYNGGFVFPGAVDKGVTAEMRANGTEDTVMAYAIDLKDRVDFKLSDPAGPKASWARYIYGIALEMKKLGVPVKGFNIAFAGELSILTLLQPNRVRISLPPTLTVMPHCMVSMTWTTIKNRPQSICMVPRMSMFLAILPKTKLPS